MNPQPNIEVIGTNGFTPDFMLTVDTLQLAVFVSRRKRNTTNYEYLEEARILEWRGYVLVLRSEFPTVGYNADGCKILGQMYKYIPVRIFKCSAGCTVEHLHLPMQYIVENPSTHTFSEYPTFSDAKKARKQMRYVGYHFSVHCNDSEDNKPTHLEIFWQLRNINTGSVYDKTTCAFGSLLENCQEPPSSYHGSCIKESLYYIEDIWEIAKRKVENIKKKIRMPTEKKS